MRIIIGVMGGANVPEATYQSAYRLGQLIAGHGWVLLNGGRNAGVMAASAEGAHSKGGLVVGVLPGDDHDGMAPHIDIPIVTGMGSARNNINVLSSNVIIACQGGAGTLSEVALARKADKPVILLGFDPGTLLSGCTLATTPEEAVEIAASMLSVENKENTS